MVGVGEQIVSLFVLALPVAAIAWTVTHEEIFREPREWCAAKSRGCRRLLARKLMAKLMKEKGIAHTTSECTLRGFTCATVNVDPKVATPSEIAKMRKLAVGHQVEGITGGLEVKDKK